MAPGLAGAVRLTAPATQDLVINLVERSPQRGRVPNVLLIRYERFRSASTSIWSKGIRPFRCRHVEWPIRPDLPTDIQGEVIPGRINFHDTSHMQLPGLNFTTMLLQVTLITSTFKERLWIASWHFQHRVIKLVKEWPPP